MLINCKFVLLFITIIQNVYGEEAFCSINGKKALHKLNEKFLSISIDPAVLLTGLNLSEDSLKLAKHLSPAFIRVAGPSTKYVKYVNNEDELVGEDSNNIVVTPSMWFGINEWLILANLTPLYAINDVERTKGLWNPKSTLPLLEISDKLNLTCYWQLGFDCSNKTEQQYKQDIDIFRNILDAFPERKDNWHIIASDLNHCFNKHPEIALNDVNGNVEAVMWEPQTIIDKNHHLVDNKQKIPIWTSVPKPNEPVTFDSTILWAQQTGNAAKMGYEVIFREPRLHEIFSDTPVYWYSILHKMLMGNLVLDVKTNRHNDDVGVFAHCTKKQNSFVRRGAMTILIINNGTEHFKALFRQSAANGKTTEIQTYLLNSSDDGMEAYLNDEKLTKNILNDDKIVLTPKIRRAKTNRPLTLELPPKSIGFFVLPNARVPICINENYEMNLLLEEMNQDQNLNLSEELVVKVSTRSSKKPPTTLQELHKRMENELKTDERYYKRQITPRRKQIVEKQEAKVQIKPDVRQFFIERAKLAQRKHAPLVRNRNFLQLTKETKPNNKIDLDLNSKEVKTILKTRAKVKAAQKNIIFSSAELNELIGRASKKYVKPIRRFGRAINMPNLNRKLGVHSQVHENRNHLVGNPLAQSNPLKIQDDFNERMRKFAQQFRLNHGLPRLRREINMDLLKMKTKEKPFLEKKKKSKSYFKDHEEKEATIRQADQSSEELLRALETEMKESEESSSLPKGEVYAELAETVQKKKKKPNLDMDIQILTSSQEFVDFEEDFPYLHEFSFDGKKAENKKPSANIEFWNISPKVSKKKKTKTKKASSEEQKADLEDEESDEFDHPLFKRDLNQITRKDVKKYKKIMNNNLKDLKLLETQDRLKSETESLKSDLESSPTSKKMAALKKKMSHKKKLEKILRKRTKEVDFLEHIDKIADSEKNEALKSKLETIIRSRIKRNYKSLTENLEIKPNKFVNQNEIYYEDKNFQPRTQKPIFAFGKNKRSLPSSKISSLENEIEDITNDFERNLKFIHPKIDDGKIELILPNEDELKIERKGNKTDFAFYHRQNEIVKSTTDKNIPRNISHVQKIPTREEEQAINKIINHVTGWFHSIGDQIRSFMMNIF